ncbi:MAG: uracil-xanthine permease [Clostridia bacterium]|nr:uracil-xanthine permease [Clostridia bacterium]
MQKSNLIYNIQDKPPFGKTLIFALQQLLAIMAATIAVPAIIGNGMSAAAALFGAGAGTLIYLLFTKFKSPVFLGSSFAFLGSMGAAFAGAVTVELGYLGLILGAIFAGLVYVVIAFVVKRVGTAWISKIMPPQVIGPTVAIIGLSLSGNAIGDLFKGSVLDITLTPTANPYVALVCGLVTLFVVIICSLYGKKMISMIPFIMGILAGYLVATIFTVIGLVTENPALQVIDFAKFQNIQWYPDFSIIKALGGFEKIDGAYIGTIAVAYVPVAFVVFAEHIADHKNLSTVIGHDLIADPGLDRTLLGDGVGSMIGAIFGGCPNTTYGESVGCVAISKNASVITIVYKAIMAMLISFVGPFSTFLATIPSCVMGGVCVALYGFIAVSGLKMLQKVDLQDNRNLFVVSTILIAGVGGMKLTFGKVTITSVACALILGILVNVVAHAGDKKAQQTEEPQAE